MKKNISIGIALVVVIVLGGVAYFNSRTVVQSPLGGTTGVTAKPVTPLTLAEQEKSQPIPHGLQTYGVGQAAGILPKIEKITVDAPDAKTGDAQRFSAIVDSDAKIVSVVVKTKTDTKETATPLTLKSSAGSVGGFTYEGSWTINDAHAVNYLTTFIVKDAKGRENSVTLTWRDPLILDPATGICGQSDGTNFTLTTTCIVGSVDGINSADFTIASGGTLQMNNPGQFAWNSGHSIFISGTGTSLIAVGASIVKGFVCFNPNTSTNSITPDSATCTANGGTVRNINNFTCRGVPRPPDCL